MRFNDYISAEEIRLMNELKGKSRMEQDQIIYEYERKQENGKL